MAKESIKIELNQQDIKALVATKWGLNIDTCNISVSHYAGDAREPECTSIIVTGQKETA